MTDILVADDDGLTRGLVSDWLTEAGYRVDQVEDGEAALAVLRAEPVRLLITDMQMPRLSGAETLAAVQRELPAVRVIAMSAAFDTRQTPSTRAALTLGACRVLAKPFGRQDLLTAVREALQNG